jgi:hypothetical protein
VVADFISAFEYVWFERYVSNEYRHVFDERAQAFIRALRHSCKTRIVEVNESATLWRACVAHNSVERPMGLADEESADVFLRDNIPCHPSRMIPLADRASEGRVNPKGIPCLYLSDERKTAMREVRPSIGSFVTIGKFATRRMLKLVNCSVDIDPPNLGGDAQVMDAKKKEATVWYTINEAFSRPVTQDDKLADYAPTQVIAEVFRSDGFDGLMFNSCFKGGKNVALFELDAVELMFRALYEVTGIQVDDQLCGPRLIRERFASEKDSVNDIILPFEAEPY